MELYIGGMGQNKLQAVLAEKKDCGIRAGDVFHGEELPDGRIFSCRIVNHFHEIIRKLPEADISLFLEELYEKNPDVIIICDEVGSGIVPTDSEERRYREQVGKSCQQIAARSTRVVRIICGCMQVIK